MSLVVTAGNLAKRSGLALLLIVPVISAGWVGDSLLDLVRMQSEWPPEASCCGLGWFGWLKSLFSTPWSHEAHVRLAGAFGGAVLFVASALCLYKLRRTLLTSHARLLPDAAPKGRTVLILALSDIKSPATVSGVVAVMGALPIEVTARDAAALSADKGKGDAALDALVEARPSWQQGFRIVWDHVSASGSQRPFRAVLLVTSPESDQQAAEFIALLSDRLSDAARRGEIAASAIPAIEPLTPGGIKFEQYDDVIDALNRAVDHAKARHGARHDRVCLDVTAGTKTFSIAAAMVTLNRKLIFSYVGNDGKPLYYDAGIEVGAVLSES